MASASASSRHCDAPSSRSDCARAWSFRLRVLAADLGVARSVVVETYRNLVADGYVETRRGGWTRVRPRASIGSRSQHPEPRNYEEQLFFGWRRVGGGDPAIRLLGGLPDPALFPRHDWLRHYRAALAEIPYPEFGYPAILGAEALREALADYLGRVRGAIAEPDRILVCGGFTQGLTLICRALRRARARRVAVEEPCFGWHRSTIAATGMEVVPVPVDERGLDPAKLAAARADVALVAPAHSYPLGSTLDGARRRALAGWAEHSGALIIEDDYDAELRYDRSPPAALQGLAPERTIYIGSASKTLTPALGLGWVLAPKRFVQPLAQEKHHDDLGTSLLEQHALARFIETGAFARHLRRVRPIYRDRRDQVITTLEVRLPIVGWRGEPAGLHIFVSLPSHMDVHAIARAAFEQGVLVEFGSWHWAASDQAPPSLVLGYGSAAPPAIRRGLEVLADVISRE